MSKKNLLMAIKAKCLDCSCGSIGEVKRCEIPTCPLYPFRSGKDQKPPVPQARKQAKNSGIKTHINENNEKTEGKLAI